MRLFSGRVIFGALRKLIVLLAVAACSKGDEPKPADPWGTPTPTPTPAPADDPWSGSSAPVEPPVPAASSVAGTYDCLQLRYGTGFNGMRQSTYVPSALGIFEIDGDGTVRSTSYPGKGTGQVRVDTTTVTFDGGPYAGSVGVTGTTSSGSFHIRFSENLTDAPSAELRFNDHMCYRK